MKLARLFVITLLTLTFCVVGMAQEKAAESLQDKLFNLETVDQSRAKRIPSQDSSLYVISVKAGIVNLVDGDVSYKHSDADWDMLIGGDELRTGDTVRTGASGRVELLLNPGSYLRVAENSEVVLTDASLDDLKIQILKGTAILEVSMGSGEKGIFATLITPQGKFLIVEGGIYRLNVDETRTTAMVRKGKLVVPQEGLQQVARLTVYKDGVDTPITGTVVKSKNKIVVEGTSPMLASLDKNDEDSFDGWSKDRAKTLVAANQRLSNRALNRSLFGSFGNSFWVYNPFLNGYTYLPGWYGFYSPYGFGYSTYCNPYYRRYYPSTSSGTASGGNNNGGTGRNNGGRGSGGISGGDSRPGQGTGRSRDTGSIGRSGGSYGGGRSGNAGGGSISRPSGGFGGGAGGGMSRPSAGSSGGGNGGGRGSAPASPRGRN